MKLQQIFVAVLGFIAVLVFVVDSITKFKNSRCQSKFGPELNERRKQLGISIVPPDWVVYSKDDHATLWQSPKKEKGHGFKVVVYDGCELDGEEDHYYFDSKKIHDSVLDIDYKYVNSKRKKDSTVFTYQLGNHLDTITRKQADSIFLANHVKKDD